MPLTRERKAVFSRPQIFLLKQPGVPQKMQREAERGAEDEEEPGVGRVFATTERPLDAEEAATPF